jgi:hypothetical protein
MCCGVGLEVVGKSTSAPVDPASVAVDLRSMVEAAVESKTQATFMQLLIMMTEIADMLESRN